MKYQVTYKFRENNFTITADDEHLLGLNLCVVEDEACIKKQNTVIKNTIKQLDEYFVGKRTNFDLPIKMSGTPFQEKVWENLRKIPYGSTISYKQLAEMCGNSKASRAVGMANNKNLIAIIVPCHRVIGSNGSLIGYAGGLELKSELLELEKINGNN